MTITKTKTKTKQHLCAIRDEREREKQKREGGKEAGWLKTTMTKSIFRKSTEKFRLLLFFLPFFFPHKFLQLPPHPFPPIRKVIILRPLVNRIRQKNKAENRMCDETPVHKNSRREHGMHDDKVSSDVRQRPRPERPRFRQFLRDVVEARRVSLAGQLAPSV